MQYVLLLRNTIEGIKGHWVTYCFQAWEEQWSDVKQKNGGETEQAFREKDLTLPCVQRIELQEHEGVESNL